MSFHDLTLEPEEKELLERIHHAEVVSSTNANNVEKGGEE